MTRLARRLVFGLGNPGSEYHGTRHNVGFEVLEYLALHEGLLFEGSQSLSASGSPGPGYAGSGSFGCARSFDPDALLVKPLTFMNRSGEVVSPLVQWTGVATEQVLVVYDDMDLDPGVLRLRPFGGAGGQKGMRSIIDSLGTDRFPRLRIGIGRPPTAAARHVLSRFSGKEREGMDVAVAEAAEAVLYWLRHGNIEGCMARFHSRWNDPA